MILEGTAVGSDIRESADVCVVGSGAGGSYLAWELARRGLSVVVVEEGGVYFRQHFTGRIQEAFRVLYRNNGLDFAIGRPAIIVPTGKCLGGTTVVNMGVCFRAPQGVLAAWESRGLAAYGPERMAPVYAEVEERMGVRPTSSSVLGRGGELVLEGARSLGLSANAIRRNVSAACRGCGHCAYGCSEDAKQSMAVAVIPEASAAGALFLCDTRVERIVVNGGRAVGVSGRVLDRTTGRSRFRAAIRAKVVVAAAGALHTPALLTASGIAGGNQALGRHLKLHLCARATGIFDEAVDAFRGACQGVYVDDYLGDGIMLEGTFTGPCSQLPGLFGFGPAFGATAASYRHMAGIGILISERAEGRVVSGLRGKPLLLYQASRQDAETMHRGMLAADRVLFAAGARQVVNGSHAFPVANRPDDLDRASALRVSPQELMMMAFHPQGTCRMGVDRRRSVVGESGECHAVAGLYLADASVFPSSIGVNPQETVWAIAHTVARSIARDAFDL